jgi:hypothetical protein
VCRRFKPILPESTRGRRAAPEMHTGKRPEGQLTLQRGDEASRIKVVLISPRFIGWLQLLNFLKIFQIILPLSTRFLIGDIAPSAIIKMLHSAHFLYKIQKKLPQK